MIDTTPSSSVRFTAEDLVDLLAGIANRIHEQREYLTQLDSPIGDADHGTNLDRGFTAIASKLPATPRDDAGAILKMAGMTLVSTVGGAAGPLYGTALLRAAGALGGRSEISGEDAQAALEAALVGIQERGKSHAGEKTMIDTIAPAVESLKAARSQGEGPLEVARAATEAAEQGMRSTIPMLATKGRASYLGERSIGHQDPGATSSYLIAAEILASLERIATRDT